ncbi:MAG: hypothetical protein RIB32_03450 [Phycisphaerales bacterium]
MTDTDLMRDDARPRRFATIPPVSVRGAFYLACSWTWVLGMFFPVLMIKDFGWPGYLLFAVPNCIGAMSVGFMLPSPAAATEHLRRHAFAISAFTVITVAFHAYFLAVLPRLVLGEQDATRIGGLAFSLFVCAVAIGSRPAMRAMFRLAPVVFIASWACLLGAEAMTPDETLTLPGARGIEPPLALLYLVVPTIFGFALCPYLDVSFIRQRALDATKGGRTFALGFLIVFPLLILGTLLYANAFIDRRGLHWLILGHFGVQAFFTIAAHAGEAHRSVGPGSRWLLPTCALAAAAGAMVPMSAYRLLYETFMSSYGLLFPAYVLIFAIPMFARMPVDRRWRALVVALVIAAPMFAAGYLGGRWFWLAPGMAAVLLTPLIFKAFPRAATPPATG